MLAGRRGLLTGRRHAQLGVTSVAGLVPVQARAYHDVEDTGVSHRLSMSFKNYGFMVVVGEEFAVMVNRFEKFHRQLEPGLNFKIPFVDKVSYAHDLREQVVSIPKQNAVTKDNVTVKIDGILYI